MNINNRRNIILIAIIAVNLFADQITKHFARLHLNFGEYIRVIGDLKIFQLTFIENDGAFLSLGSTLPQPLKTWVLVLFPALAIIAGILYLILGKKVSFKQAVCVACIIGGGIGNVWDRAVHQGAVTDFLYFYVNNYIKSGILNVADLSITFGAIFLFIFQYREEKLEKQLKDNDKTVSRNS